MPRWTAIVKGTLHFKREMTIYAANETDADIVAEELTMLSSDADNEIVIDDIKIIKPLEDKRQFEILLRKKE